MFGCKQEDLEIANEAAKEFFGINFLVDLKKDEENDREKRKPVIEDTFKDMALSIGI